MDQKRLIENVLQETQTPEAPAGGRYLSFDAALGVVDETIDYVGRHGDAVAFKYLGGHRRRLATTLTMIPFAERSDASCLDVGCFGYMAFWAWKHLGYARVEGIEMRPDIVEKVTTRAVRVNDDELSLKVYNFDISTPRWPLQDAFDTVLFLETLEHVATDPMGVLLNVTGRMHDESILVISVPNSVSYKTLQEFVAGMPPWTYWFFSPDLRHEPRHSFEYTPLVFKVVLRAAGLAETAFRTICAYADRENLNEIFAIGEALSIDEKMFGDTLIAQAKKAGDREIVRYPDCIYDGERYYRSTFPAIEPTLRERVAFFASRYAPARSVDIPLLQEENARLEGERANLERLEEENAQLHGEARATREQLTAALLTCEHLLSRIEEMRDGAAHRAPRSRALFYSLAVKLENAALKVPGLGPATIWFEREMAKFLCSVGVEGAGTSLWNRAKALKPGA